MAKGIIVVDVPEKCSECPIEQHDETNYGEEFNFQCPFKYKGYTEEIRELCRADWCPIKPMPEKRLLTGDVSNVIKTGYELVRIGWNACIDEILKEDNENVYN